MLWAQKIDGDVGDILTFEDLVSEQMAKALFVTLSAVDRRRLSKPQTDDPDAYQAYLMGRFLVEKHNPGDTRKSVDCFNEAVRIDARYALAHVGLHRAYITLVGYGALPPKEGLLKAKQSALRAIELEPMLADAHACLGLSQMFSWDWLGAQQKYKLSIELNPNNPRTHQLYSAYLRNLGKRIESLVESGRAQELDPVSVNLRLTQAINLLHARQYDDALKEILKVTQMEVRLPSGHFVSGLIYEQLGSLEKAIIEFEEANSLIEYYNPEISANLARAYALSGNNKKARELLSILLERSRKQYIQPYHLALVYGALGEVERLFAFLEKSYREHDYELCLIKVDSRLDEFHNDSRYRNLLERVFSSRLEPGLT
jgi:tetratricopeptide (TPR) repeat protein